MAEISQPKIPTSELFKLDNRTVLVTGGLGGVGSEICTAILESGGDVLCFDRHKEPNLELYNQTAANHKTKFFYASLNVTSSSEISSAFSESITRLRYPLLGVVTCAGISGEAKAEDYPEKEFRRIHDINVMGTFLVVQVAAKHIRSADHGRNASIVMIASMSGSVTNKGVNTAAYNSSKSALLQLGRSLAAEWGMPEKEGGSVIRVNTVSPGYIITPLSKGAMEQKEVREKWLEGSMLGRFSRTEEHRGAFLFLLSEASSFVTGSDLRCDGGQCAWG
ncbi:oxidoreductase [Halenospora varia]|nr:oxidoreductase [Halenospora varia]